MQWNGIFTSMQKDNRNFIMLVAKNGYPSIWTKGPRVEDHIAMNACILGNAYLQQNKMRWKWWIVQRRKLQKIRNKLQVKAMQVLEVWKSTMVKFYKSFLSRSWGFQHEWWGYGPKQPFTNGEKQEPCCIS